MTGAVLPTALLRGLTACDLCGRAEPIGAPRCGRCGARRPEGGRRPLGPVLAWLAAGLAFYIPANVTPMLVASQFGRSDASTIVGGAIELMEHGAYGVASIVLIASVMIPLAKFAAILLLVIAARPGALPPASPHGLHRLYEIVEFIGRWSMIDVFVVAVLAALVQLGFLASIAPGPAAAWFALSVACTMLSARAFDPRHVWDRIGEAAPDDRAAPLSTETPALS